MKNNVRILSSRLALTRLQRWILILWSFCLVLSRGYGQDILWGLTTNFGPQGAGTIFSLESTGTNFKIHKAFESLTINPQGSLVQGRDGSFYGMTTIGGSFGFGTVFKMDVDGTFTTLKYFSKSDGEGAYPYGSLVQGRDGSFYGMTSQGGSFGFGTVFKMDVDGTFITLKSFNNIDGAYPQGNLVQGSDGSSFYGITSSGGLNGYGTVFRLNLDGTFNTLKEFSNSDTDGTQPSGSLVLGTDGAFYGVTKSDPRIDNGIIFKLAVDGTFTKLIVLNDFSPSGSLVQGTNGSFYGMTQRGGRTSEGTVFKMDVNGTFTTLKEFDNSTFDGAFPQGSLVLGTDGFFYGVTSSGGSFGYGTVFKIAADGTFTKLKDFDHPDGTHPNGSLVQGTDGFFYGMTANGSIRNAGTAFKIDTEGNLTTLRSFGSSDGANPTEGLVQGTNGSFYGMTSSGGSIDSGTVFRIDTDGTFTLLKNFGTSEGDGANPIGSLVQGTDGSFYGMTKGGGSFDFGTVFKIAADGTFTKLKDFDHPDGTHPNGSLVQGTDGFFYGMTTGIGSFGFGTVFKIAVDGTFTTIKHFDNSTFDGAFPYGSLVQATNGVFYGMTEGGGSFNLGTIFKISVDGTFTKLKDFDHLDGTHPNGSLVQGTDGSFYGMTSQSGSYGAGTIFKMEADGTFTKLKDLNGTDGATPLGSLVQGTDGFFYGLTTYGGSFGYGTVFKIAADGSTFITLRNMSKSDGVSPSGKLIIQKNPITSCTANGFISREQYTADLFGKPVVSTLTALEAMNQGDLFVARLLGYLCPPQTGNYTFWIAGDAATRLTLSPNADPAQAQLLAYSFQPTNFQEYNKYPSQQSAPVYLEAGKKYYIEAQHAAGWGSDHVSVAWQLPDGTMEGPIPGSRLSPYTSNGADAAVAVSNSSLRVQLQDLHPAADLLPAKGVAVTPNPFTVSTLINYVAQEAGEMRLELFTNTGKLLQTLFKGSVKAGSVQQYVLDGNDLAAGVYICRLTINNKSEHTRLLLIK